jgi:hypothetical protein
MVKEVKLTSVQIAETLIPNPSALEDEMAAESFKRYKSPSTAQIPEELFHAVGRTESSEIY